jgi:uncharacterized coiled-coil protein SlyX
MPAEHHATLRLIAAATLLALAATAGAQKKNQAPATKKLYCWTENGRKVCGDALPAEAAGTSRTEYSKGGRRTGEVAAALTPEERAAAEAAAIAAVAKAESDAARTRREMAMVESYATEADLRKAFQERIDLLDETLKASGLGVVGLRQSLVGLLRQAGEIELSGKPVPPVTRDNIARQHAELQRRERMYAQQQADRAKLDTELAAVLARYREIKSGNSAAAAPATPPPSGG